MEVEKGYKLCIIYCHGENQKNEKSSQPITRFLCGIYMKEKHF